MFDVVERDEQRDEAFFAVLTAECERGEAEATTASNVSVLDFDRTKGTT
jgi:hypothetical protein